MFKKEKAQKKPRKYVVDGLAKELVDELLKLMLNNSVAKFKTLVQARETALTADQLDLLLQSEKGSKKPRTTMVSLLKNMRKVEKLDCCE